MLYNIFYCPNNDRCFGWPAGRPLANIFGEREFFPQFLAIYETETDSLELHDTHFNWYGARDVWDEELNRAVQEIIDSPVVWYCLIHGECQCYSILGNASSKGLFYVSMGKKSKNMLQLGWLKQLNL